MENAKSQNDQTIIPVCFEASWDTRIVKKIGQADESRVTGL